MLNGQLRRYREVKKKLSSAASKTAARSALKKRKERAERLSRHAIAVAVCRHELARPARTGSFSLVQAQRMSTVRRKL